jgi:hypothetical protein
MCGRGIYQKFDNPKVPSGVGRNGTEATIRWHNCIIVLDANIYYFTFLNRPIKCSEITRNLTNN